MSRLSREDQSWDSWDPEHAQNASELPKLPKYYSKEAMRHLFLWDQTILGSFTVAIFAYFSAPFQPTFWLLFVTLAEESTKGEQKGDEKWAGKWLL